jgi:hypothetical protein
MEEEEQRMQDLARNFLSKRSHLNYVAFNYVFCQFLSIGSTFFTLCIINHVTGGKYLNFLYQLPCLSKDECTISAFEWMIPKQVNCTIIIGGLGKSTFDEYGVVCNLILAATVSGSLICVWFLNSVMFVIDIVYLIAFVLLITLKRCRLPLIDATTNIVSLNLQKQISEESSYGELFGLSMLGTMMPPTIFQNFILSYSKVQREPKRESLMFALI